MSGRRPSRALLSVKPREAASNCAKGGDEVVIWGGQITTSLTPSRVTRTASRRRLARVAPTWGAAPKFAGHLTYAPIRTPRAPTGLDFLAMFV